MSFEQRQILAGLLVLFVVVLPILIVALIEHGRKEKHWSKLVENGRWVHDPNFDPPIIIDEPEERNKSMEERG